MSKYAYALMHFFARDTNNGRRIGAKTADSKKERDEII